MTDIIKTWPGNQEPRKVLRIFCLRPPFTRYFFSLGRAKPKQPVEYIWFTYRGRVLGKVLVEELIQNDGSLPRLNRLEGGESGWQFKHDVWIAVCLPTMERLRQHIYHGGFRGWRYFDLEAYRATPAARWNF